VYAMGMCACVCARAEWSATIVALEVCRLMKQLLAVSHYLKNCMHVMYACAYMCTCIRTYTITFMHLSLTVGARRCCVYQPYA
jgi:hypothetical protein